MDAGLAEASAAGTRVPLAASLRCSFCTSEVEDSAAVRIRTPGGHRRELTAFCSLRCRDCVLALGALNPSVFSSAGFLERRTLLTDRLIRLWRNGEGPDPALVLMAAERARLAGLTSASTSSAASSPGSSRRSESTEDLVA
jgi:hypothetical protein